MLHVYFGSDTSAVRKAAWAAVRIATASAPHILTSGSYEPGQLSELVGNGSLFGDARVVLIDTPREVLAEEVQSLLAAMAASSDTFIIIEGSLLAAAKKQYAKHTTELHEFTATARERFNTFAIADALIARNKKQLWLQLQKAVQAGISPEEIIGVLWWQLKSIRLAAVTQSADAAGMKTYPYNKAKRALANIPLPEAERLAHDLLTMYHAGHAGETDLALALEEWVLRL